MKKTISTLRRMKSEGEKIAQLTCYDFTTARLAAAAGVDSLLVGDSLGMVMQGYETTLPVTMEEMIIYGRSVVRGSGDAFVVIDMPFMSYQPSEEMAVESACRLIKETGANMVKIEGGAAVCGRISAIARADIPVCAHIGMTPQSVNAMGGYKVQAKDEEGARRLIKDALAVQEAGASMIVLECVPPKLASIITSKLERAITIGIGAGAGCDGQVLVYQDMLGMQEGAAAKFVREFAPVGVMMKSAFGEYVRAVRDGTFPDKDHSYSKSDCPDEFLNILDREF